ncbi:MAG TPA: class I SAM-dependent methyltransferase [Pseudolabrys sp.]|jgi:ubiquinone/menaquinone biosynthesis C-methylase UbiE|nr:class I SAM-dependent methyltransferase [Pseudolabrys sp.]
MAPRIVARHLSHPRGHFGRLIGFLMNRHNARMNAFAVKQLSLRPDDHVLEIGFGGGATLPALIAGAKFVVGVDRSADVVGWAKSKYARAIAEGRAEFHEGHVETLPFESASFGKVCTVNTVYFWKSLETGFAEIRRVLVQGGRVAVGFLPKDRMARMNMPADIFTLCAAEDVVAALKTCGFGDIRVEQPQPDTPWNVIIASC